MRRPRLLIFLLALVGLLCGGYLWLGLGERGRDVLGNSRDMPEPATEADADAPGRPLFNFGSPYLDGRSVWARAVFEEDRKALRDLPLPPEPVAEAIVHRQPITTGPWVAGLTEEERKDREETERQNVEGRLTLFVKGVSLARLALFLAVSRFQQGVEGEGEIRHDLFMGLLPASLEGLDAIPRLRPGEWISRQRWARALARPTDAYFRHRIIADGASRARGSLGIVYEAWRNVGDSSHAVIRWASGHYALVARDGGVLCRFRSYYSGQSIPPLLEGLVEDMTRGFYRKLAAAILEGVRTWEAPDDMATWFGSSLPPWAR